MMRKIGIAVAMLGLMTGTVLAEIPDPKFVFYSSVVFDPNNAIENSDGMYTVHYPITTAIPSTGQGELQYPTFDILPDTLVYPTYKIEPDIKTYPAFKIENILMPYDTFDIQKDTLKYDTFLIEPVKLTYPTFTIETVKLTYPTFDIQRETVKYDTFLIDPVKLECPTFNIENITLPYPTFDILPDTLSYPTYQIEPVRLEYPTYELANDSLTCNTYHLVQEQVMCNTYSLDTTPVCQDVPYTTYEISSAESCIDHTTWTIDFNECSNAVIVGTGVSRMCADQNDKNNCCWPLQRNLDQANWKCYGIDPSLSMEVEKVCPMTVITEEIVPVCIPTLVATPVQMSVRVCVDSITATNSAYAIDTVRAIPATTQLAYQKAVPAIGYLDSIKATPTTGSLETIKAVPRTGSLDGIKATPTVGTLDGVKATPTVGYLETIKAVPTTGSLDGIKATPAVGTLDSVKATPTVGYLETIKAVPIVKNLDGIKATETTGSLESIKATPTTGTLETIKAVPKTETATYEYPTFEVTEEEKLIDVYVDVPESIDPPATVTDTFVGILNLEAKAWFFTRPRGGNYTTDIRVVRITGGNGTPLKREVLEAWGGINKVKKTYAGSERVELSKLVPTDQAGQIRIIFKATAPNGDYRKRKVFINVLHTENPEANASWDTDLMPSEEE